MAITYAGGVITVTGYTIGVPCNFTDIYNADVANGWGVVLNQGTAQFLIQCKLCIGDGVIATWFADTNKQVELMPAAMHDLPLEIKANANFRLGTVVDANKYITKEGCILLVGFYLNFIIANNANSFEIYSSDIRTTTGMYAPSMSVPPGAKLWNSLLSDVYPTFNDLDIRNVVEYAGNNYASNQCSVTSDNWIIYNSKEGIVGYVHSGFTIKNTKLIGSTRDFYLLSIDVDCYAINVTAAWIISWSGNCSGKLYRQQSFNLKVVDVNGAAIGGAKVQIWDVNGGSPVVDTTTYPIGHANEGEIPEHILNYGYYDQAHAPNPVMETPHTMRIYKYGYQDINSKFDIVAATDWSLTMVADPYKTKSEANAGLIDGGCNP